MEREVIKIKRVGSFIIAILWTVIFFENFEEANVWNSILLATISTMCVTIAFNIYRRLDKKLNTSRTARCQLAFWYVMLIVIALLSSVLLKDIEAVSIKRGSSVSFEIFMTLSFIIGAVTISMMFSKFNLLSEKNKEHQVEISELKALNTESELTHLKNQLNPHFLFNALSNIYSIAYLRDERTPDKIMELTKMLRYVIYEADVDFIVLSKEIEYLNHYIEFQKFKIKKKQQIDFDYTTCDQTVKIAPLILLTFIENAFKHSQLAIEENAWVNIMLRTDQDYIYFDIENTISTVLKPKILDNQGIGLENIKNRLTLIYKESMDLTINNTDDIYKVSLKIKSS
ncbi:sensor histidine kinase [Aquimarina rhabdastrellae]